MEKTIINGYEIKPYADLREADLSNIYLATENLRHANFYRADLSRANLNGADLEGATLKNANLSKADLRWSNLNAADLRGANLEGANLDFSCLPLWCGSLETNFDDKQIIQIAYHLVKAGLQSNNVSEEIKSELSKIKDLANKFHRLDDSINSMMYTELKLIETALVMEFSIDFMAKSIDIKLLIY